MGKNYDPQKQKCDIFISYKTKPGDTLAKLLYDKLVFCGFNVFLDSEKLNDVNYEKEIEAQIKDCTDFLVLLFEGSLDGVLREEKTGDKILNEDWMAKEIRWALKYGAHIIPILKEGYIKPEGLPEEIDNAVKANGVYIPEKHYFDEAFMRLINVFLNCKHEYADMDSDTETERKANEGDPFSMNDLAMKTEMGTFLIQQNKALALEIYKCAAENGSVAACYNIGDIYEKCAEDPHLSRKEEYNLDNEDCIVSDKDKRENPSLSKEDILRKKFTDKARFYYMKAGDSYAPALYRLGVLAEKEDKRNEAFEYYNKAQELGYAPAINAVGYFYENGIGKVQQNTEKALELFESISDKLPHAAYNYARLWSRENDDAPELDDVKEYYEKAFFSREPVPQAAFALAELYKEKGEIKSARHYYYLALEYGYYKAKDALKKMDAKIVSSRQSEPGMSEEMYL